MAAVDSNHGLLKEFFEGQLANFATQPVLNKPYVEDDSFYNDDDDDHDKYKDNGKDNGKDYGKDYGEKQL